MEKITKFSQARKLATLMTHDSSIELQLYDEEDCNEILHVESSDGMRCVTEWNDTVNGIHGRTSCYIDDLAMRIWQHRKFINNSGQLKKYKKTRVPKS